MIKNKILSISLIAVAIVCMLFSMIAPVYVQYAFATTTQYTNFDYTDIMTDLTSSTLAGKQFDIEDYPYNENGELRVINIVEFGYSYYSFLNYDYGIYIYVYNPAKLNINTSSLSNKIEMATSYDNNNSPVNYSKFSLKLCNKSTGTLEDLFYKFKIDFTEEEQASLISRLNQNKNSRQYDISSIELLEEDKNNTKDYTVDYSIIATGFAKGLGQDTTADSTLNLSITALETLPLKVNHTFFRNYKGNDIYTQLDTVYFAIDNDILEYYGNLQRIKAEWYEYKLKEILVTESNVVYNMLLPYLGEYLGDKELDRTLAANFIYPTMACDWVLNPTLDSLLPWPDFKTNNIAYYLYLMFKVYNIEAYNPLTEEWATGGVNSKTLYESILNYNKSFDSGTLPVKNGTISADLFQNDIDVNRKIDNEFGKIQKGYSYYDFDIDVDLWKMQGYQYEDKTFLENIKENGLWNAIFKPDNHDSPTFKDILPIYELSDNDFKSSYSNEDISQNLLVQLKDISALKEFYTKAKNKNQTVFLFRFATSDYYSAPVTIIKAENGGLNLSTWNNQAYISTETVFLDFDIIQLTFKKDDIYKVIPVVSNPIDIVNDIVPPLDLEPTTDILGLIIKILIYVAIAIVALLLLSVLAPYLPMIIQGVVRLISLPFTIIGSIIKSNKTKGDKKK